MEPTNNLPEYSEKYDVILGQLMKAKAEMGSVVKKDANNPFHKSKYASLGAHLELSESVLFTHGLLMLHTPTIINGQHILVATIHHPESGQWTKGYFPLLNAKGDSQGVGASITYMRRYSINCMLGLTAEDDDGETACGRGKNQEKEKDKNPPPPVTKHEGLQDKINKAEVVALETLLDSLDEDNKKAFLKSIKENLKANSIQDIPKSQLEKCMTSLNNKIKFLRDQQKVVAIA